MLVKRASILMMDIDPLIFWLIHLKRGDLVSGTQGERHFQFKIAWLPTVGSFSLVLFLDAFRCLIEEERLSEFVMAGSGMDRWGQRRPLLIGP